MHTNIIKYSTILLLLVPSVLISAIDSAQVTFVISTESLSSRDTVFITGNHAQFFSKVACLSPAFKIDQIDYVSRVKNSPPAPKNIRIYIDNGDVSLDQQLQPGIDEMINTLEKKGLIRGIDFQWHLAQNNNHNESAWAQRVWRFLRYFYPAQGK
jgi:hypothetical protein